MYSSFLADLIVPNAITELLLNVEVHRNVIAANQIRFFTSQMCPWL